MVGSKQPPTARVHGLQCFASGSLGSSMKIEDWLWKPFWRKALSMAEGKRIQACRSWSFPSERYSSLSNCLEVIVKDNTNHHPQWFQVMQASGYEWMEIWQVQFLACLLQSVSSLQSLIQWVTQNGKDSYAQQPLQKWSPHARQIMISLLLDNKPSAAYCLHLMTPHDPHFLYIY